MEAIKMNPETFVNNPVLNLQVMLRSLSQIHPFLPAVPLDGFFGETTLEAVLQFQKELFPPATGVVDQEVWNAIRQEVLNNKEDLMKPKVLRAYPENGDPLVFGEERAEIALFQLMFQLLSDKIQGIQSDPPTGTYTQALRENVHWLQTVSGLPISDQLTPQVWDRLARLYEIYITAG